MQVIIFVKFLFIYEQIQIYKKNIFFLLVNYDDYCNEDQNYFIYWCGYVSYLKKDYKKIMLRFNIIIKLYYYVKFIFIIFYQNNLYFVLFDGLRLFYDSVN